jgi:hypothetical protein
MLPHRPNFVRHGFVGQLDFSRYITKQRGELSNNRLVAVNGLSRIE